MPRAHETVTATMGFDSGVASILYLVVWESSVCLGFWGFFPLLEEPLQTEVV